MMSAILKPETVRWLSRLVGTAVGLLLLVTASMKLYDLLYGQASALLWLPSPRWILAAVEFEIIVGLWLLSSWQARWAFRTSLVLFAGMAVISFYLGMTGQSSCGCLGRVEVSPWLMLPVAAVSVNAFMMTAVVLAKPTAGYQLLNLQTMSTQFTKKWWIAYSYS